jgi:ActR/RegA family two-component response regulator
MTNVHEENDRGVLLLDDDENMLGAISDVVGSLAHRPCITVPSYDALIALGEQALSCAVAILDINLGHGVKSGIDAYLWLKASRYKGRVVFLTGHARGHPLVEEAHRLGQVRVLQKPTDIDSLLEVIER